MTGDEEATLRELLECQDALVTALDVGQSPADAETLFARFDLAVERAGPVIARYVSRAPEDFAFAVTAGYLPLSEIIARFAFGIARINELLADDSEGLGS